MKKYNILLLCFIAFGLYACNKLTLTTPAFDVTVNKTTFKVGDSVVFVLSGNPDNIGFYSGEVGHIYDYKNRTSVTGALNQLSFSTATANLAAGNTGQTGNLKLLVSSNFTGQVDSLHIRQATWTDVTNRATIATNATATSSGTVNLSDFQQAGDSLYVAFKYLSNTSSTAARARQYTVSAFVFQNTFPDGTIYVHNTINTDVRFAGFAATSFKGTSVKDSLKWAIGSTLAFAQGVDNLSDEDWAITKKFRLSAIPPDVAVGIKNNQVVLPQYVYKYTKPGTYTVTFVGNNVTGDGISAVTKTLTITVTP
ncbi:DUF5017 domain-containing protein [Mucilaginibacter sp. HMF5004]|uniref:DUF5017 domain-containing protein n=1 Tax=Mucilaginibacter rivuli TaxID=2857527 RepID=UPI001C5E50E1|nr:DUF5017 domain-containing protein [Mucilaginibacter rivuli]MBW4889737.1 DUF5017 domain-containing protein [Mucilaginibacter rivuli]